MIGVAKMAGRSPTNRMDGSNEKAIADQQSSARLRRRVFKGGVVSRFVVLLFVLLLLLLFGGRGSARGWDWHPLALVGGGARGGGTGTPSLWWEGECEGVGLAPPRCGALPRSP